MKIREVRPQSGDMKPVDLGHLRVILISDETSSQLAVILKVFTVCMCVCVCVCATYGE